MDTSTSARHARRATVKGLARAAPFRRGEQAREALLDAACGELRERRWDDVRMLDVARRAGIERNDLYVLFRTRRNLIRALVAREAERVTLQLRAALDSNSADPAVAIATAFARFLTLSRENGLLAALRRSEETELRGLAGARRASVIERMSDDLILTWPELRSHEARRVGECLERMAASFVLLYPQDPEDMARHVGEMLGAYVEHRRASASGAPAAR